MRIAMMKLFIQSLIKRFHAREITKETNKLNPDKSTQEWWIFLKLNVFIILNPLFKSQLS